MPFFAVLSAIVTSEFDARNGDVLTRVINFDNEAEFQKARLDQALIDLNIWRFVSIQGQGPTIVKRAQLRKAMTIEVDQADNLYFWCGTKKKLQTSMGEHADEEQHRIKTVHRDDSAEVTQDPEATQDPEVTQDPANMDSDTDSNIEDQCRTEQNTKSPLSVDSSDDDSAKEEQHATSAVSDTDSMVYPELLNPGLHLDLSNPDLHLNLRNLDLDPIPLNPVGRIT